MGFLREAGLSRESARQYRTAVPAVEESFRLQCPHVSPYGHFGGLDDAGELLSDTASLARTISRINWRRSAANTKLTVT